MPETPETQICHRCGSLLRVGHGELYHIRIEAVADPEVDDMADASLDELKSEMHRLLDQMEGMSEQELVDQVHRKLSLVLCTGCYTEWIENPTGDG